MTRLIVRLIPLFLAALVMVGGTSCKNSKKAAAKQAAAEYAAKKEKARQTLLDILNDNTAMSLTEQEKAVANIKAMDFNDPEIDQLIREAENKLAEERSELNRLEMEAKKKEEEAALQKESAKASISDYFASIATARSVQDANMLINDALSLFNSPDAPVLIVIAREGDIVDYDRPTTIRNYLNYLKDTKNNINKVDKIIYDANGKIKELELIKMR
jgi:hypothetical protein